MNADHDEIPNQTVDYEFWCRMSGWTVKEAAALMLDIDPDKVAKLTNPASSRQVKLHQLVRLLKRAHKMDQLSSPMTPRSWLAWASSNKIKYPDKLKGIVSKGTPHRNWRTRYNKVCKQRDELVERVEQLTESNRDSPAPKERTSMLLLIGGMARAKYKHSAENKNTTARIERDLQSVKCTLSNNTIKKYLNEADVVFDEKNPKNVK